MHHYCACLFLTQSIYVCGKLHLLTAYGSVKIFQMKIIKGGLPINTLATYLYSITEHSMLKPQCKLKSPG